LAKDEVARSVCLTGQREGFEAEKRSSQEDAGRGTSEEVSELDLKSNHVALSLSSQQGV